MNKKKVLIAIAILLVLFIVTAVAVLLIRKKNGSAGNRTSSEIVTSVDSETDEYDEDDEDDIYYPPEIPAFNDISSSEIEYRVEDAVPEEYNEYFYEDLKEQLMSFDFINSFDKDIKAVLTTTETDDTTGQTYLHGTVENTDIEFVYDAGDNYANDEVSYVVSACNKYGSDYSNIYWNDGVPADSLAIYKLLYNEALTGTYVAESTGGNTYLLTDTYSGSTVQIYFDGDYYVDNHSASVDDDI